MSRRIEESNIPAVKRNGVRADMLGYTARFSRGYAALSDIVEKRSFTVVDVSHYGYYGRTRYLIGGAVVVFVADFLKLIFRRFFGFVRKGNAQFARDKVSGVEINHVVNRFHNSEKHKLFQNFASRFSYFFGKLFYRDKFRGYNGFIDGNGLGNIESVLFGTFFDIASRCAGVPFFLGIICVVFDDKTALDKRFFILRFFVVVLSRGFLCGS